MPKLQAVPAVVGTVVALTPTAAALATVTEAQAASSRTYYGPSVNMQWGPVRVGIGVSGKRLLRVFASAPTERSRSASINNRAVPILDREALSAKSAKIHSVSGATLTSRAFESSLASALRAGHV